MRILVAGDVHGYTEDAIWLLREAVKRNCDRIVICGDFGYWPHQQDGKAFLLKLERQAVAHEITVYFIDGNHDNHPILWKIPPRDDGFVEVSSHVIYIPRGHVWEWDNLRFLGVGGAYSIDKERRVKKEKARRKKHQQSNWYWWPTEMLTEDQAVKAALAGKVDVMFTHDAPAGWDIPGLHADEKMIYPQTTIHRLILKRIFDCARPRLLMHGHYHIAYNAEAYWPSEKDGILVWDRCLVRGLAHNRKQGFFAVLDTKTLLEETDIPMRL